MSSIVKLIPVSSVIIKDRIRQQFDEEKMISLMDSMNTIGLLEPIIVSSDLDLIAGGRRLESAKRLKWEEIEAKIIPIETVIDSRIAEIDENEEREEHTFSESLRIYDILKEKIPERRGKKAQGVDIDENENVPGLVHLIPEGVKTIDWIAGKIKKFRSRSTLQQALKIRNTAIPEVISDLNDNLYSINFAYTIAEEKPNKQLSLRNKALADIQTNSTEFNKSEKERRKAKRKDRLGIPQKTLKHQQFNVIRFAPDWDTIPECEILDTPINDYASPRIAVLAIECSSVNLQRSFELLDHFGFGYSGIITVHNPKAPDTISYQFANGTTHHILLGKRIGDGDVGEVIQLNTIRKVAPVISRSTPDLASSLIPIIEQLFPNSDDRRIDMSSPAKRKNWINWKTSYGIDKEPEEDDINIDQIEAFEQAASENVDEEDHVDVEMLGGRAISNSDLSEQADTEESFEVGPRKLKIF